MPEESPRLFVDLHSATFEQLLRENSQFSTYREKEGEYIAHQVKELIVSGKAEEYDIFYKDGSYWLRTWAKNTQGEWEVETLNQLLMTDWVIENSSAAGEEHVNRYAVSEENFADKYTRVGDHLYVPSSRGFFFPNFYGKPVEVNAPWGLEKGDPDCYFFLAMKQVREGTELSPDTSTWTLGDGTTWYISEKYVIAAEAAQHTYVIVPGGPVWPATE